MNEIIEKENVKIEDMIYEIRGKQVILDRDLANLYNVETKILMQNVKRNIERFPESFMFQLNDNEFSNGRGGRRYRPYAFTEQGVTMLAGFLKSKNCY